MPCTCRPPTHVWRPSPPRPACSLTNWLVIAGTCVWVLLHVGVNLQPFLAVGGASGIVIGLATQQVGTYMI